MNLTRKFLASLVILSFLLNSQPSQPAHAASVRYAKPVATGTGDCTSWANACLLQTALTGAAPGDEIWVMAGTHKPTTGIVRTASFQLVSGVEVYGGFDGTETVRDQRDLESNMTVLSGDLSGNDDANFLNINENSYHVVTGSGTDATAILDGFTISGGNANGTKDDGSGGGLLNTSNGSPTLVNILFSNNYAASDGGGMSSYLNSNPSLTKVTFSGNHAPNGGGMSNYASSPSLTNITFNDNSATSGGGMYNNSSSPSLRNVTFSNNSATSGGGMYNNSNSTPSLINVIVANSVTGGDCVNNSSTLNVSSSNNLIEDGAHACGLTNGSNGNIIGPDPLLGVLSNTGIPGKSGFPLLPGSPAIDAGTNTNCPSPDQRGVTRPQRGQCDIGAYEYDYAGVYYSKPAAVGTGDCTSWGNACALQSALSAVVSGDEVWVMAGVHKPTTGGDRAAAFQLTSGTGVYGGFDGSETVRDQRDPAANLTVLSGDLNGDDGADFDNNGENSYHVVVTSGTDATAILDGLTISGGNANGANGGGIYNVAGSPTLTNLTISNNYANYGGGLYSESVGPALTSITFSNNSAVAGGGIAITTFDSTITVSKSTFSGNSADDGGGFFNARGTATISNSTFLTNTATSGGGIENWLGTMTVVNSTFSGNSATVKGGGIYNDNNSNINVHNTILWANNAPSGAQISNVISIPVISYSIVQGSNGSGVSWDTSLGTDGGGNLDADPVLGILGDYGGNTQTIPLLAGSSAIDAGDDASCEASPVNNMDQRGVTRPQGMHCDMGAYEYTNQAPTDISLSPSSVDENQPVGTTVGTLSTTDPDVSDTFTYTFCGGTDDAFFSIIGSTLKTAVIFDYETKPNYSICIRSTDNGSLSTTKTLTINVNNLIDGQTFADVPTDYWSWGYIERLYASGITGGCGTNPLIYCPEASVTRAQMAVFLLRGVHGSAYKPPAVGDSTGFGDVPVDYWAAAWIKQLVTEGITVGCGDGSNYCPDDPVTRAQMAVFLLRSKYGSAYKPPAVGDSTGFADVPTDYWAAAWVKQLVAEGITSGCGDGNDYCPEASVTRAQMAVFLVKTFGLP